MAEDEVKDGVTAPEDGVTEENIPVTSNDVTAPEDGVTEENIPVTSNGVTAPGTAPGDDVTEENIPVTSNDVTAPGDDVTEEKRSVTRAVRIAVTDINWLSDEKKLEGESLAVTLSRLHGEIDQLREVRNNAEKLITDQETIIEQLTEQVETLSDEKLITELEDPNSETSTALTSADQTSLGDFGGAALTDTMDAIKDVCDDETVCIKTALKMVDTKSDLINKQLNRDHVSAEKAKDREEREKDRKLKEDEKAKDRDLERERMKHQKELVMIRKGMVNKDDLEDVVFLGSVQTKSAKDLLKEKKRQAYAASEEDDNLPSISEGYPEKDGEEWE